MYDGRHTHCTAAVSSVDDGRRTMNKSRKTCCQYSKTGMTNRLFAIPVTMLLLSLCK
ncbi:MAG: hypothetical protein HXL34_01010 [Prevotellaceae bacterium]|nr:hypothetical protein [Prevotellaceae bacterium]